MSTYTSEDAINREGFLSGILAVKVGSPSGSPTGMAVKLTITESDQQSTGYAQGGELVNFDLDLVGLKQYVKVKVEMVCTGGSSPSCTATAALALGDASEVPV